MLETQLKEVEAKIQAACDRAGRKREEVTLIAVSKTKPIEMLQEAYDLGVRVFGENKVQEITAKYDALPDDIHWHMIRHLQTNKVKYIIDKVDLIHSVDSVKLAETIEKEAAKHIGRMDRAVKQRLKNAIERLPAGDVKKLQGVKEEYRLRVGDLRVIFSVRNDTLIIKDVLPRGEAYKRI